MLTASEGAIGCVIVMVLGAALTATTLAVVGYFRQMAIRYRKNQSVSGV